MWDGESEYEGQLITVDGGHLIARVRQIRRWTLTTGAPGRPVPLNMAERQRLMTRRVSFAQSPGILTGALLEFRVSSLQPSRDRQFDFVLAGGYEAISDEHLQALSEMNTSEAPHYLQQHRRGDGVTSAATSGA